MGHRLSKIYTRTGDDGDTGLGDGSRVTKTHPRVVAYGTVDELNSIVGIILAHDTPGPVRELLTELQHELFDLGAEFCVPGHQVINAAYVERLERALDALNADLPPLKEFVLPGGGNATAHCHVARAVCRRAERCAWALADGDVVNGDALRYLNRLSDLLFVIARVLARHERGEEVLWRRRDPASQG